MNTAPSSWWRRNWKWFVPVLIATIFALVAGLVFAVFFFVMRMMSSSEPYQTALARARANPQLIESLGTPMEPGWFASGSINVEAGGSGQANLAIPLSGPRGAGKIYVEATRSTGQWDYDTLMVTIPSRDLRVDLREDEAATK